MWLKVSSNFHRSKKPVIGTPTLVGKTWDDNEYQSFPLVSGVQKENNKYHAKTLPTPPKNSSHPRRPDTVGMAGPYSQDTMADSRRKPSISLTHFLPQDSDIPGRTDSRSISPPDSPVFLGHGPASLGSSRVSSLEEEFEQYFGGGQTEKTFTSHIPVLRKHADNQEDPTPSFARPATAWDTFSREQNNIDTFAHAAPGCTFETHISSDARPIESRSSDVLNWGREQKRKLSGARSRPKESDLFLPPNMRVPWKGASGRSPIVEPLQEKPRARSSSRVHLSRSSSKLRGRESPSPSGAYLGGFPSIVTTISSGEANTNVPEMHAPSKNIHRTVFEEPTPPATSASSRAPPRVNLPEPDLTSTLAGLKLTNEDDFGLPSSRFSVTTYEPTEAGSSTATGSPRGSIDAASQSTEYQPSIMSRKRPVPSSVAPGKKPSRKPTPSQETNELLPCTPAQQTQNRIEMLEARRDYLARRKASINTMIYELTQVIQPSPIAYDLAARDEVKKTVASLNNELADIIKEEHEIGMKLFRAWRKRDEQECNGGSSGLWVKRVTS
ncbi:hypothetical protein ANOM_006540 [Aspergillus nomiae NRRL 13137]|uniref:BHLH domain-containing protein n=1 Tax=Aspergillus nomiae NRRL (strain ATCC 15546 / NRRL 13137 / CBS 260.88 / M93) TaxID=1509407 RepID=A0A0L1IZP5_ASPN3|nr:uncharacterized protein ANOM_006540 [Aspergillus nomiae NRRL 13137]KNG84979.1 hypothetical protein ANOM_006540 [Aspergillus nomiae NRRL 13137]